MLIDGKSVKAEDFDDVVARLKAAANPFTHSFTSPPAANSPVTSANLSKSFNDPNGNSAPAHMVEQGQVGFSNDATIGTVNVADCVGLIVRDTVSGKTALAHIDRYATPNSLSRIFDGMPKDHKLEVVLWGAKYGPESEGTQEQKNWSESNLRKVVGLLADRDVNIVGAEINNPGIPSAVTVNPGTFEIRGENPERPGGAKTISFIPDPDEALSNAKMILNYSKGLPVSEHLNSIDLETGFDLTRSQKRMPLLLRQED